MIGLAVSLAAGGALAQGAPPFQPEGSRVTPSSEGGNGAQPDAQQAPAADNAPPRLLRFVQADYPPEAQQDNVEGPVLLELTIDTSGHVSDARVAQGLGHGLDEAALAAARQFEFSPARQGGQNVAARIRYRYRFSLRAAQAAAPQGPVAILRGVVRDASNRAVPDAEVRLALEGVAEPQVQRTDRAGQFRFELSRAGGASVTVTAAGLREYHSDEHLAERDDVQVIYRMAPAPAASGTNGANGTGGANGAQATRANGSGNGGSSDDEEEGLTVRGRRPPREVTRTTIDRQEILRIPGTGGDALRAIQNLPGLARAPFLSGALIVRGASPQDTQVFADGTELPLLYHFGGLSSTIQTEMLDRIDFYPGNFSAQFGRAMGGIVDVGLRSPRQHRDGQHDCHAVANINLIDASIFAECAITRTLSAAVAVRRSYVDVILGAVLSNASGIAITAAPVYYDYQGVLEWRPAPHHRLRLALLGDDDTLHILFKNPADAAPTLAGGIGLSTRYHIAQFSYMHDFGPGTMGRLMVSGGWTNVGLSAGELFKFDLSAVPINARYEFSHTLSRFARMNVGLDLRFGQTTVQVALVNSSNQGGIGSIGINTSGWFFQPAAYAELELTPLRNLRLVPGVRIDYFHDIAQATVSPRVNGRWDFLRGWTLKAGVGEFTQPPQPQESSSAQNSFFPGQTIGNPHLLPERAMHYDVGIEHAFSPWISLSVDGFYKSMNELVVQTPAIQLRQPNPPEPYSSTGLGRVYGMEVLLRHRASNHFFGWIAYTLLRSERSDGPGQPWHLFDYDQTHILTVVASYNIGWGWEVGARFRYVTGSPLTPVIGSYYNTDSMTYSAIYGPTNSARNANFNQLDLRVDKSWRFRWGSFGVFLEVLNVYNSTNQEGTQYNYNYEQSAPVAGLPIFPNLGVRGEL